MIDMKRQKATILSITAGIVASAAAFSGAMSLSNASAATTDKFITPDTYEQYLPLEEPSSVAMSDDFVAISDENKVYVYSKREDKYFTYTHTANVETEKNRIKKLQFSDDDTLYFLDNSTYVYSFHPNAFLSGQSVTATGGTFSCSDFVIGLQDLYFTSTTLSTNTLSKTSLNDLSSTAAQTLKTNIIGTPALALDGNLLYYIDGSKTLKQTNADTQYRLTDNDTVKDDMVYSVAVVDGLAYFTTIDGKDFYVYDLAKEEVISSYMADESVERGYSAISVYNGCVYVIKNESVCEYSPSTKDFTDFEIGASSTSSHRLQNAVDSVVFEDKVYVLDKGAKRVSIYDTIAKTYQTVDGVIAGDYLATDGKTVFVTEAHAYNAALYDIATGESLLTLTTNDLKGNIVGVTNVYGKYYFVTISNQYGCLSYNATSQKWEMTSVNRESSRTPDLLASDVQGNLYVSTTNGSVYRMTEEAFMTTTAFGEALYTGIESDVTKMLVDYEQAVYFLKGNTLHKYAPSLTDNTPLGKALAYTQDTSTPVSTIAFGAERAEAYIVYDGNLMISTLDLGLPCMANIETKDVDEDVFSEGVADFKVVKTALKTLLVEFDLEALEDADVFPYLDYQYASEELTALQIGETTDYALLAIFHEDEHAYRTYLVRKDAGSMTELAPNEYREEYATDQQQTGWLSSAANLYKFPYLTELLTVNESGTTLPKNQQVLVLGEITQLDYNYYHVQYVDENGNTKTGYIPMSFVKFFEGTTPVPTESTVGDGQADSEAGWRFLYIMLGCTAVLILVDFLILMPKPKKED